MKCNKEGCSYNVFGGGYCKNHQYLRKKNKVIEKKDRGLFVRDRSVESKKTVSPYELDKWFKERRREMTGFCEECGKPSFKNNDKKYKYSIAHLIPKEGGKSSVSCNEFNFIELCWVHHQEYDSSWEKAMKMNIWQTAKRKVNLFLHLVKEKKKFLVHFK